MVSLARRNLLHDRLRFAITVAGVAFAVTLVLDVFEAVGGGRLKPRDHAAIEALRTPLRRELARRLYEALRAPEGTDPTTPGTTAVKRMEQARAELLEACDGFLRREAIAASLTRDERLEILRGMALTRAVDSRHAARKPSQTSSQPNATSRSLGVPNSFRTWPYISTAKIAGVTIRADRARIPNTIARPSVAIAASPTTKTSGWTTSSGGTSPRFCDHRNRTG